MMVYTTIIKLIMFFPFLTRAFVSIWVLFRFADIYQSTLITGLFAYMIHVITPFVYTLSLTRYLIYTVTNTHLVCVWIQSLQVLVFGLLLRQGVVKGQSYTHSRVKTHTSSLSLTIEWIYEMFQIRRKH